MIDSNLIFDLGMHRGEDTYFYLKKGFRVVAVDADPELCSLAAETFAVEVDSGQLTIVNKAISDTPGTVTLYRNNDFSIWNTLKPEWARRNQEHGADSTQISVLATPLSALIEQYGAPYYLKVDIEGLDLTALKSVGDQPDRPTYISIESDKLSFSALRHEFDVFGHLGYDRFKIVPQHRVQFQRPPRPALEGRFVDHLFEKGSSGLFGEEAPGRWLSAEEAIEAYRPIFLRYALTGDEPFIRNRYLRAAWKRLGFRAGWYDTHARVSR